MMSRALFRACTLGAAASVTVAAAITGPALSAQAAARSLAPAQTQITADLNAISASSATDAWSVGENPTASPEQTQTLHWNGTSWTVVPSPDPGTGSNYLSAVSDVSPSDAWAAGYDSAPQSAPAGLLLHWDGTSWTQSANPVSGQTTLAGVSALSATDAWSVGDQISTTGAQSPLALHWDGTAWAQVTVPDPTVKGAFLNGVTAISANNVWAVGQYVKGTKQFENNYGTLIMHWNGTSWRRVASPSPCAKVYGAGGVLNGVDAVSASQVWAVGSCSVNSTNTATLVLRWDGHSWTRVPSPTGGLPSQFGNACTLSSVSADSSSDAWAVGYYTNARMRWTTLTLHWNGTAWTRVASPSPSLQGGALLYGVAAISAGNAWAAGASEGHDKDFSLLLNWNGTAWTRG